MGGLAERLHPADLPAVLAGPGAGWGVALFGVLAIVVVGLVMTALMQSSTAAIALTLSAHYAGAIGLDQACALIIGQNIGTATSSAMAAIGASSTAKRLAVAYILFKLIAAVIALALFPVVTPLLAHASSTFDGVTLLAGYHTAYNVVGVAVLMPVIDQFTLFVERLLPERGSPLTRCLDPSALATPIAAVEAVRRTVARALEAVCRSVDAGLVAAGGATIRLPKDAVSVPEAADASARRGCERPARVGRRAAATHEHIACARPRVAAGRNGGWAGGIRQGGRPADRQARRTAVRGGDAKRSRDRRRGGGTA
jgi:phosphate:Na+ symporter